MQTATPFDTCREDHENRRLHYDQGIVLDALDPEPSTVHLSYQAGALKGF